MASCSTGILRERFAGFFLDQLLVIADDHFQIGIREIRIQFDLGLVLALVKNFVELVHVDVERHLTEHLNEAAVAIVGETRIPADLGQALDSLVVQAEVENGVHHARHGEFRAGSDAQQQRIGRIAELLAHLRFQVRHCLSDFLFDLFRE